MFRFALVGVVVGLQACVLVAPDEVNIGGEPEDDYVFTPSEIAAGETEIVAVEFPPSDRHLIERVTGVRLEQSPLLVDDWQTTDDGLDLVVTAPTDAASGEGTAVLELDDGSEYWLNGGVAVR